MSLLYELVELDIYDNGMDIGSFQLCTTVSNQCIESVSVFILCKNSRISERVSRKWVLEEAASSVFVYSFLFVENNVILYKELNSAV